MVDYNPCFVKGTLVVSTDPEIDELTALEMPPGALKESGRIQLGPLQYYSIEYQDKEPVHWVRSKEAWYRLLLPNKGYKDVFRTFLKKVTITHKMLSVWSLHPNCSLIELAKHGQSLQLDEIAEHGQFIMDQLRENDDPALINSELFKKSLPDFLNRYKRNAAQVRV